jgi:hypothetical protein
MIDHRRKAIGHRVDLRVHILELQNRLLVFHDPVAHIHQEPDRSEPPPRFRHDTHLLIEIELCIGFPPDAAARAPDRAGRIVYPAGERGFSQMGWMPLHGQIEGRSRLEESGHGILFPGNVPFLLAFRGFERLTAAE